MDHFTRAPDHRASQLPVQQLLVCLSCPSCLSMFSHEANRFNGTWSLIPIGHEGPLFHSRMTRPVVWAGGPAKHVPRASRGSKKPRRQRPHGAVGVSRAQASRASPCSPEGFGILFLQGPGDPMNADSSISGRLGVNGVRLAYTLCGQGTAVVFLHGWMCNRTFWRRRVPGAGRSKLPLSGYRLSRTRRLGSASRRLFHRATGRRRGRHHGVTGAGAGRHRGSFHGRNGGSEFLPGTTGTDGRSGAGGDHRLRSGRPADLQENRLGCPPNGFSPRFRPPFRCLVRSRHPEVGPPLGQDADAVHARRPRPGTGRRLQPLRTLPAAWERSRYRPW